MTVEECLRQIRVKATMLEQLADSASVQPLPVQADVFAGVAETCVDIAHYARAVHDTLNAAALDADVKRPALVAR